LIWRDAPQTIRLWARGLARAWHPQRHQWALAAICLLGLVLRLHEAYLFNRGLPNSPLRLRMGDEPGFDNLARDLLAGHGFDWPARVPGYPLWVAFWHAITNYNYRVLDYAQAVLGTLAVPLTYYLGRQLLGVTVGLLAALGVAASVTLIHETGPVLSEVLYVPLLLVGLIALVAAVRAPTTQRMLAAGAWLGVGALVRPMMWLFPLVSIVLFLALFGRRRALRAWVPFVVGTVLALSSWVAYTAVRWHAPIPLQTSNAILWQGSPEYYHLVHDEHYSYLRIWKQVVYGPGWQRHDPTSVAGDRWWTRRAIRSIITHPGIYLLFAAEKTATYWVGDSAADWGGSHVFDYGRLRQLGWTRIDAIGAMIARFTPVLALLAVPLLWRRRRTLLPIYAVLIYATLLAAATHAEARLSEPLQPVILILVAGGVTSAVSFLRSLASDHKMSAIPQSRGQTDALGASLSRGQSAR
jgi:4-amino-4-deoxy-L-arabinose transferase-like glycosyltransferase